MFRFPSALLFVTLFGVRRMKAKPVLLAPQFARPVFWLASLQRRMAFELPRFAAFKVAAFGNWRGLRAAKLARAGNKLAATEAF